jgi:alpha-ketoglutarate-dependent taurine dioxygenase
VTTQFAAHVVDGIDPAQVDRDDAASASVRQLLVEHAVLCIRLDRALSDDELRSVVEMFGPIKEPVGRDRDGTPLRYGEPRQVIDSGFVMTDELREQFSGSLGGDAVRPGLFEFFHTDDSYTEQPAACTVLHARALPESGGGATSFLDMRAAYRLLDEGMREELLGLVAIHSYNNHSAFPPRASASGPLEALVDVAHPIVRAHPASGEPALYFDLDRATRIEGLPIEEGRALLRSLQEHAELRAPRYAHEWRRHDVLVWDNASVQHKAGGDFPVGEQRRFWRYMVEGQTPTAFAP